MLLLSLPPLPAAEGERKAMERTAVEITSAFVTINGQRGGRGGEGVKAGETPSDGGTHDDFMESKEDAVSPH